jgi:hypothetical protein
MKPLNKAQSSLLALIATSGPDGCVVYGRGPSETVYTLQGRGLVENHRSVMVATMGGIESRPLWTITVQGVQALLSTGGGI